MSDATSPAAPAGFAPAARLADVPDGGLLAADAAGRRVCLARAAGEVTALDDECPHAAFPLSEGDLLPDGSVRCAWHGARFDRSTGALIDGPACGPATAYDVVVDEGVVYVRVNL